MASFMSNEHLQQFILCDVIPTDKILGTGSYGSVLEVEHQHLVCAAKKLHEILLQSDNEGVADVVSKYQKECELMASLRHPNITQFFGICFLPGSEVPLLVMERLEMSLDDLLECVPNLPLVLKLSFLEGVCCGLVYLHSMQPPVVHRDLTARNVLLTSSLVAKISDLGNSRIVNIRPGELARTLTQMPGTLVYMPPEAMSVSHRYGASLDIFSFGHLALYTITQVFPGSLLTSTYPDPNNPECTLARSEVERRGVYMNRLELQVGRSHPTLVEWVKHCLHNAPGRRPSGEELLDGMQGAKEELEGVYGGGDVLKQLDVGKVLMIRELKMKEKQMEELEVRCQAADRRVRELEISRLRLETENRELVIQKERDIALKDSELAELKEEVSKLSEQMQKSQEVLESSKVVGEVQFPLNMVWRKGHDLPFGMTCYIQSVAVQGTVYVGGGLAGPGNDDDNYIVMAYDTDSHNWHRLPPYRAEGFAMAVINRQLVLVGGRDRGDDDTDVLGVWEAESEQWTHPYPPMSSPRYRTSAVAYRQWLLVAGGMLRSEIVSTVEVLDVGTEKWLSVPSMPASLCAMRSTIVGDMWYLMGGSDVVSGIATDKVYSVSLSALISHNSVNYVNLHHHVWNIMTGLDHNYSTPLGIGGSLLAVGGRNVKDRKAVSAIHRYLPDTEKWVGVGELPSPLYHCTCAVTTAAELLVAGGVDTNYRCSSRVYIGGFI